MAKPVFFMHDGAVDELLCIPLLQSMSNIDLSGIWITPADCLGLPTATACEQLLDFIRAPDVALFLSDSSSQRPFPWTYRQYALMVNLLPDLNLPGKKRRGCVTSIPTRTREANLIARSVYDQIKQGNDDHGTTTVFLVTAPLTDFVWLLENNSAFQDEVDSVTWMGGTLSAGGNIDTGIAIGANPNAEWNAYWDPFAVDVVLKSSIALNMFPLDVTNQFLLTPAVLQQYFLPHVKTSRMINLASQMYALVAFQAGFSFWDTAAASSLGNPHLFTFAQKNIAINLDEGEPNSFGCMTIAAQGQVVNVASLAVKVESFYTYLIDQLASVALDARFIPLKE
jgi:purine nucleosidase